MSRDAVYGIHETALDEPTQVLVAMSLDATQFTGVQFQPADVGPQLAPLRFARKASYPNIYSKLGGK